MDATCSTTPEAIIYQNSLFYKQSDLAKVWTELDGNDEISITAEGGLKVFKVEKTQLPADCVTVDDQEQYCEVSLLQGEVKIEGDGTTDKPALDFHQCFAQFLQNISAAEHVTSAESSTLPKYTVKITSQQAPMDGAIKNGGNSGEATATSKPLGTEELNEVVRLKPRAVLDLGEQQLVHDELTDEFRLANSDKLKELQQQLALIEPGMSRVIKIKIDRPPMKDRPGWTTVDRFLTITRTNESENEPQLLVTASFPDERPEETKRFSTKTEEEDILARASSRDDYVPVSQYLDQVRSGAPEVMTVKGKPQAVLGWTNQVFVQIKGSKEWYLDDLKDAEIMRGKLNDIKPGFSVVIKVTLKSLEGEKIRFLTITRVPKTTQDNDCILAQELMVTHSIDRQQPEQIKLTNRPFDKEVKNRTKYKELGSFFSQMSTGNVTTRIQPHHSYESFSTEDKETGVHGTKFPDTTEVTAMPAAFLDSRVTDLRKITLLKGKESQKWHTYYKEEQDSIRGQLLDLEERHCKVIAIKTETVSGASTVEVKVSAPIERYFTVTKINERWIVTKCLDAADESELGKVGSLSQDAVEDTKFKGVSDLFTDLCIEGQDATAGLRDAEVSDLGKGKKKFEVKGVSLIKEKTAENFTFEKLDQAGYGIVERLNRRVKVGSIVVLKVSVFGMEHVPTEFYVSKVNPTVMVENRSYLWSSPQAAAVTQVFQDATEELQALRAKKEPIEEPKENEEPTSAGGTERHSESTSTAAEPFQSTPPKSLVTKDSAESPRVTDTRSSTVPHRDKDEGEESKQIEASPSKSTPTSTSTPSDSAPAVNGISVSVEGASLQTDNKEVESTHKPEPSVGSEAVNNDTARTTVEASLVKVDDTATTSVDSPTTQLQPSKENQPAAGDTDQSQVVTGGSKGSDELESKVQLKSKPEEIPPSATPSSPELQPVQQGSPNRTGLDVEIQQQFASTAHVLPAAAEMNTEVTEIKLAPTSLVKVHSLFGGPKNSAPKNAVVVVYQKNALVGPNGKVMGKSNTLPTLKNWVAAGCKVVIFTPSADRYENKSLTGAGFKKDEHFTDSFQTMQNASYPTVVRNAVEEKIRNSGEEKVPVYVVGANEDDVLGTANAIAQSEEGKKTKIKAFKVT